MVSVVPLHCVHHMTYHMTHGVHHMTHSICHHVMYLYKHLYCIAHIYVRLKASETIMPNERAQQLMCVRILLTASIILVRCSQGKNPLPLEKDILAPFNGYPNL